MNKLTVLPAPCPAHPATLCFPSPASRPGASEASVPAVTVVPDEHGRGYFVFVDGKQRAWFTKEVRAWLEKQFLDEFAGQVRFRLKRTAMSVTVNVTADHAAGMESTCPDCTDACKELGEAIRKKLMEAL